MGFRVGAFRGEVAREFGAILGVVGVLVALVRRTRELEGVRDAPAKCCDRRAVVQTGNLVPERAVDCT